MVSDTGTASYAVDPSDGLAGESLDSVGRGDAAAAQEAAEYCYDRGWTDGLPVIPCTERRLGEFLERTERDPDDVVLAMPHLNRQCTVREAAANAVMAGCLPGYFPVVLAAWESLGIQGIGRNALWQSTTGSAPLLVVNGPVTRELNINGAGDVFGSGFRANATIGRAIRLAALNVFSLRSHLLDQATQGTPAKYTCCIAENEADSPWQGLHVDHGFGVDKSTVTAFLIRGTLFIEARHTLVPEQLALEFVDSIARTGRVNRSHSTAARGGLCLVLSPEHARIFAESGWTKADMKQFLHENSTRSLEDLDKVGKGGISKHTASRVPVDHPDAVEPEGGRRPLNIVGSPEAVDIVVAGADNAGVSTVAEMQGDLRNPENVVRVDGRAS